MRIEYDEKGLELKHIILNGDGESPEIPILESICNKYDGVDKIILYPRTPIKKPSGLSALDVIKDYLYKRRRNRNFIFMVDGEYINENAIAEIRNKLTIIGIEIIDEIIPLQKAFLINCKSGNHNFKLYCVIWGPETCIEEEIKVFIELTLNIRINTPTGPSDAVWRAKLRKEIWNKISKREFKRLIKKAGRRKLEESFPNICAVLRKVEEDF